MKESALVNFAFIQFYNSERTINKNPSLVIERNEGLQNWLSIKQKRRGRETKGKLEE